MKRYEDKEVEIVTVRECVEASCDMCGRKAEFPDQTAMFSYCVVGVDGGELRISQTIDGDYDTESIDLCYKCGELIIKNVRSGVWNNKQ